MPSSAAGKALEQLEWEMRRVTRSGRVSQYLMLRDVIIWAREQGIPVSPGYGRLCGSMLAYALGLCEPDPYAYGLVIPESPHIYSGAFGINVSADRAHELVDFVKDSYIADDCGSTVDLVELFELDLMQAVAERVGLPGARGCWDSMPLDDPDTFRLLQNGETDGVYQIGTGAAKEHLRQWRPSSLNDLFVLTALTRYGAESLVPHVIECRRSSSRRGADPMLDAITSDTFGFVIYQEQIIRVAAELAGLDIEGCDNMRKAMSRRRGGEIEEACERFVRGYVSHRGVTVSRARDIWDELERCSVSAVGKAHVVAHGLLSYRMAYLKAHWPVEYGEALEGWRYRRWAK